MKKLYILIILFIVTFLATQIQARRYNPSPLSGKQLYNGNNMPGISEDLARKAGRNVYDLRGREVYRESFGGGDRFSCRQPELRSGAYLVRIGAEQGVVTERPAPER